MCRRTQVEERGRERDRETQRQKRYWEATISRLHKIGGLFCRIQSLLKGSFAKETYHFEEPNKRSHSIECCVCFAKDFQKSRCVRGVKTRERRRDGETEKQRARVTERQIDKEKE